VVLLRGINIGAHNRVAMPALREALARAGFDEVATHLQSGNIVLSSQTEPEAVADACSRLIADTFGLTVPAVARTHAELEAVVYGDPLGVEAIDPRLYQVTFCRQEPDSGLLDRLDAAVEAPERLYADGRELYAWHPSGIARSRLAATMARLTAPIGGTARNWKTVTALLDLASR
jgi:uncharacterized protein (DUF1697 family)